MRSVDRATPTIDDHRPAVEPFPAKLHIGVERQPFAVYVWDDGTARWDDVDADYRWDDRQEFPYQRMDLFCRFHGLTITAGGLDNSGLFDSATLEMTLDNRDGELSQYDETGRLVDWQPGSPVDIWANLETTPGYTIPGTPQVDGYLTSTVGTVTTPDPGPLPNQFTIVTRIRHIVTTGFPAPARQHETEPVCFTTYRTLTNGRFYFETTADGVWANRVSRFVTGVIPTLGADSGEALAVTLNNGSGRWLMRPWHYDTTAATWVPSAATVDTGVSVVPFDSANPIRIGTSIPNAAARLYSVELRTGTDPNAGTVVWRFDANDYPGTGTSYVDPRGRTWTLTSAAAITPKIPAVPPVDVPAVTEDFWLFSGRITAWREMVDGTVDVEAFDTFSYLNQFLGRWTPGFNGQTVAARLTSICARAGYIGPRRFDAGDVTLLTAEVDDRTALEMMQAAAISDGGALYCDADGTVVYTARTWFAGRPDQPAIPVLSDNYCHDTLPVWDCVMLTDDDAIVNVVHFANIAEPPVTCSAQADASIVRHGAQTFPTSRTEDLWETLGHGQALAQWTVDRRANHYLRLEQAVLYLHDRRFDLWPVGVDLRIGDVVEWFHEQPAVGPGTQLLALTLAVSRIIHDITPETWIVTLATTPSVTHRDIAVWDETALVWDDADPRAVWAN